MAGTGSIAAAPHPLRWLVAGGWLTRRRAIAFGGVLAAMELALFVFLVAGTHGLIVPLEQPASVDFVSFYAAGTLAQAGTPELAYNQAAHFAAEEHATEAGIPYQYFFYPPVFLLLCRVLAALPYMDAFLIFQAATLGLFLLCIRAVLHERGMLWAIPVLASPAVFWTMGLGQNAFLTATLFGGATVLIERWPLIAGCLFGALCYKPHLGLLVPVALATGGHWRAFAAAAATASALALASLLLFGWQTWHDYLLTFAGSPELFTAGKAAKLSGLVTPFGAARLLGVGDAAGRGLQAGATVIAAGLVGWIWRCHVGLPVRAGALLAGTLIAAPVVLLYDLLLTVVAIAWLVRTGRERGFLAGEKAILVAVFLTPLYQIQISEATRLSPGALATVALMALCVIRARRELADRRLQVRLPLAPVPAAATTI
jgi:alpha-1,2-mannosyltransferase